MVTNLDDPDDLGRVKVKFPALGGSPEIESWWVRIAAPMAGAERGFMILPEVNDEVLIAFEHGDVNRPYIVGGLWSSTDKPPKPKSEAIADGQVIQRVLKTRAGHLVILSDKVEEEQISITSMSGHTIVLDDGSENITIKDKTGKNKMVIGSSDNSMAINVDGDFSVTAKGKITLTSTQDMLLKSSANSTIDAQVNADVKAKGNISVKPTGNLTLEAKGMADLKGNMVTVDAGLAIATIKGTLVKIN